MQASAILGLRAIAPIHVGMEDLRGVVDLAIQREKHNHWPVIFGSSVKGALREHAASNWGREHGDLAAVFGPDKPNIDSSRAGALLVNEMRLFALPVPALNTVYKWITCPEALRRLLRDCRMFGVASIAQQAAANSALAAISSMQIDEALSFHADDPQRIFLREYLFTKRPALDAERAMLPLLAQVFGVHIEAELASRLLLVSDSRFGHLAQTATAVNPHIALTPNKTTKDGALWYEESLPCESLLYLPLAAEEERLSKQQREAQARAQDKHDLLGRVLDLFAERPYFRIGANETTGMGWFEVQVCRGEQ